MKNLIRMLCAFSVVIAFNIMMLLKWIAPVATANMERGYYDAFSLIFALCGNNPDESTLNYLNANNYDAVMFVIFMIPGVLVSWLAFFALYKCILWDAPFSVFQYFEDRNAVAIK